MNAFNQSAPFHWQEWKWIDVFLQAAAAFQNDYGGKSIPAQIAIVPFPQGHLPCFTKPCRPGPAISDFWRGVGSREAALITDPGTYVLLLVCRDGGEIRVGRLGLIRLHPGYYIYIGSAFGPGGLRARLSRHFRVQKTRHWHIDSLRARAAPAGAWYSNEPERLEHVWARRLIATESLEACLGFGCSDCDCASHLFHSPDLWSTDQIRWALGSPVRWQPCPLQPAD